MSVAAVRSRKSFLMPANVIGSCLQKTPGDLQQSRWQTWKVATTARARTMKGVQWSKVSVQAWHVLSCMLLIFASSMVTSRTRHLAENETWIADDTVQHRLTFLPIIFKYICEVYKQLSS